MNISQFFAHFNIADILQALTGSPFVIYVIAICLASTIAFKYIQIRYFFRAWKVALIPEKKSSEPSEQRDMSPMQAFITTLSSALGNGTLVGCATAVHLAGPGVIFWFMFFGILLMSVRFAEVYLSSYYGSKADKPGIVGGPMLYLQALPGGKYLAYVYGILGLCFGLSIGNAMQANVMKTSIIELWPSINPLYIGITLMLFVLYIVFGGASRIATISQTTVPIKVLVFFISIFSVLAYNYAQLLPSLRLIITSAFYPEVLGASAVGASVVVAMRLGITYSIMGSESGLGTAAILFGSTGKSDAVKNGLLGMLSTFLSTLISCLVGLAVVASKVSYAEQTSSALTSATYSTLFGTHIASLIIGFLSISFGAGVLVAYGYTARACWLFLTNGSYAWAFPFIYAGCTFLGAVASVKAVFDIGELILVLTLILNLCALLCLIPVVRRGVLEYLNT